MKKHEALAMLLAQVRVAVEYHRLGYVRHASESWDANTALCTMDTLGDFLDRYDDVCRNNAHD